MAWQCHCHPLPPVAAHFRPLPPIAAHRCRLWCPLLPRQCRLQAPAMADRDTKKKTEKVSMETRQNYAKEPIGNTCIYIKYVLIYLYKYINTHIYMYINIYIYIIITNIYNYLFIYNYNKYLQLL